MKFHISTSKVGLAPGSVVFTGQRKVDETAVQMIRYSSQGDVEEVIVEDPRSLRPPDPGPTGVTWINMYGLHDTDLIQSLCTQFGVHPLAIEDIVSVASRPVVMEYDGFLLASLKMLSLTEEGDVHSEHVSLVTGPGWVLSFQETVGDLFEPLRRRIRQPGSRIRSRGAGYLWYGLMDAVVDNYFIIMDALGQRVEQLEIVVWSEDPPSDVPAQIHGIREEVTAARRSVRPLRDEIDPIIRHPPIYLDAETHPFLLDLQDHLEQLVEFVDHMRDSLTSIMDSHLSLAAMRANEIMKVLTIMASIFIPLTFVAGVYGMNFDNMPELHSPWGYAAVWIVMIVMGGGMLAYFRKKNWI